MRSNESYLPPAPPGGVGDAAAAETVAGGRVQKMQAASTPNTRLDVVYTSAGEKRRLLKGNLSDFELELVDALRSDGAEVILRGPNTYPKYAQA